ncbi:TonB-linked outer membrane protein, SusC/RagA family [Pedobacter steynii]|uniref:TonB-linked outer membrane protein, SusC/RagA family n=2 Tax=Pedobacter steynii TaxID=430522 RepID=A0A1G9SIP1_9SPHI|nr:TonB-linked outer membrane protein, SusC/RagA family [Pedobacter steynii]
MLCLGTMAFAQQIALSGKVTDKDGQPIPQVTIRETANPKNGTFSNHNGAFSLNINSNKISVSMMGFESQVITIGNNHKITIKMIDNSADMDEVVVVGYAKQKKITNTGAISSITGKELRQSPAASIQNSLAGRLPGLFQQQTSGQPGKDAANIYIRGISSYTTNPNRPLVIVDDVEFQYDQLNQIDPNEVESISILKDASTTAIYGIKGANGVIVITTRRGKEGPAVITFRTEAGLQMPTILRKSLGSYESLLLLKEQAINAKQDPNVAFPGLVSDEALEHFRLGDDPFRYPNVNWYDEVMKKSAVQLRNNIDINGGTKSLRYFISAGSIYQNGILKDVDRKEDFDNNYYLKRYNIRSNIDLDVNKNLSLKLDLSTRFSEINEPNLPDPMAGGALPFWRRISSGLLGPWVYPVRNADGSYGGKKAGSLNPVGALEYGGYKRSYSNDLNINLSADQKLGFITEGLSIKGVIAYTNKSQFRREMTRGRFPVYSIIPETGVLDPVYPELLRIEPLVRGSGDYDAPFRRLNLQAILNYGRQFGDHNVYGLVLSNRTSDIDGARAPGNFQGYAGRVGYNFKSRYLIEFNAGYNGSDRFKAKNRFGLFPAVSAGWNISEEPFFKKNIRVINYLKFRGSYGTVGSDEIIANRYLYEEVYNVANNGYYFGETPTGQPRVTPGTLGNDDVRWEKEHKMNIGLDMKLFDSKLEVTADYFDNLRYDILSARETVPLYSGLDLPPVNKGRVSNKGFELELNHRNQINDHFQYFIRANASFARNKILFRDEPDGVAANLKKTGRPVGQLFGYISEGFYYDEADIANSPKVLGKTLLPGDLKYKDVNGDGVIDGNDVAPIGNPEIPEITYGFSAGFSYRDFDFSFLLQGAGRSSVSSNTLLQIGNVNGIPSAIHLKRWTPETRDVAEYPRLGGVSFDASTFWLRPADYIRLKNVELGYHLPKSLSKRLRLMDVRFYANGLNLFTLNKLKIYDVDPEVKRGTTQAYENYPQMKIVNFGVQVTF